jgi:hypothetical protein
MMDATGEPDTIEAALSLLIGQRLLGTRNFCATRQFYFGREYLDDPHYTLGVECPWSIGRRDILAKLLGDLRGELAVNTGAGLVVESVHPEMCSGFRIDLSEACVVEVAGALVLMNGVVTKTKGKSRR